MQALGSASRASSSATAAPRATAGGGRLGGEAQAGPGPRQGWGVQQRVPASGEAARRPIAASAGPAAGSPRSRARRTRKASTGPAARCWPSQQRLGEPVEHGVRLAGRPCACSASASPNVASRQGHQRGRVALRQRRREVLPPPRPGGPTRSARRRGGRAPSSGCSAAQRLAQLQQGAPGALRLVVAPAQQGRDAQAGQRPGRARSARPGGRRRERVQPAPGGVRAVDGEAARTA